MLNRREFLKTSTACSGALLASSLMPEIAYANLGPTPKKLVVIHLNGGADQYSILAPVFEARYHQLRGQYAAEAPTGPLRNAWVANRPQDACRALDINHSQYALHPFMAPLMPAYAAGHLTFYMGAELRPYGINTGSHFVEASRLMAGLTSDDEVNVGFLARLVNLARSRFTASPAMQAGDTSLSPVLSGTDGAFNFSPPAQLGSPQVLRDLLVSMYAANPALRTTMANSFDMNMQIDNLFTDPDLRQQALGTNYNVNSFVLNCQIASTVLGGGATAPSIVFMNMFGFDTHVVPNIGWQDGIATTFRSLSQGLAALRAGLIANNTWQDTLVVVLSEFGRSPQINGPTDQEGFGTDHAHGQCMMLMSGDPRFVRSPNSNGIVAMPGSMEQVTIPGNLRGHINAYQVMRYYIQVLFDLTDAQIAQVFPGIAPGFTPQ